MTGAAPRPRRGFPVLAEALRRLTRFGLLQQRLLARRGVGVAHVLVSWSFAGLFAGSVLVQTDAYLLRPRGFGIPRGGLYQAFQGSLDLLGLGLLIGVVLALGRRFRRRATPLPGGRQTVLLLSTLLFLAASGFVLEGLRTALESVPSQPWAFAGRAAAGLLAATPLSDASALELYRALWWLHAVAAFALIAAIPWTLLRHALTAPLHLAVPPRQPRGALSTPFELQQVLATGNFDVRAGAATIDDFSWQERWALQACTDCGRCQDACPAHATGTALSPQALVRKLYRGSLSRGVPDLVPGIVAEDELWACTLCDACSEACPILIRPSDYVVPLRRELVSRGRLGPQGADMLSHLTYASNPFGSPHADRELLARQLGAPLQSERPEAEILYWIGCAATYDPRARRIAQAMVTVLETAGVSYAILGGEERCSGDPARRIGEEGMFQELALANLETFERHGIRKILTHCAHCFNTFRNEYRELGGRFETLHHSVFLRQLIADGRIAPRVEIARRVCLHDACYVARMNGITEAPREVLDSLPGVARVEMPAHREQSFCCGAGGANYWYEVPRREKMCDVRAREARRTGAEVLAVECPYCSSMLAGSSALATPDGGLVVRDIAELVAESLG